MTRRSRRTTAQRAALPPSPFSSSSSFPQHPRSFLSRRGAHLIVSHSIGTGFRRGAHTTGAPHRPSPGMHDRHVRRVRGRATRIELRARESHRVASHPSHNRERRTCAGVISDRLAERSPGRESSRRVPRHLNAHRKPGGGRDRTKLIDSGGLRVINPREFADPTDPEVSVD